MKTPIKTKHAILFYVEAWLKFEQSIINCRRLSVILNTYNNNKEIIESNVK